MGGGWRGGRGGYRWDGGGVGGSEDRSAVFRPSAALQYLSFPLSFSGLILPFFSPPSSLPVFIHLFIYLLSFFLPPPHHFYSEENLPFKKVFFFCEWKAHLPACSRKRSRSRTHACPGSLVLYIYLSASRSLATSVRRAERLFWEQC